MNFSVLISIYNKENPVFFNDALESILNQNLLPTEIVIVKDGKLSDELDLMINEFRLKFPNKCKIIQLDHNCGLGISLHEGIKHCSYDLIARMDSDDICFPNRFYEQIKCFENNQNLDVLGSAIEEFKFIPGDYNSFKIQPLAYLDILKKSKFLNPMSHPSVMFKKHKVIDSGSYQHMPFFEDYYLWIRMLSNNCIFQNIKEPLLYFRIGNGMLNRRHGLIYLKYEIKFYIKLYKIRYINFFQFIFIVLLKTILRLIPLSVMNTIYKRLAREIK